MKISNPSLGLTDLSTDDESPVFRTKQLKLFLLVGLRRNRKTLAVSGPQALLARVVPCMANGPEAEQ